MRINHCPVTIGIPKTIVGKYHNDEILRLLIIIKSSR